MSQRALITWFQIWTNNHILQYPEAVVIAENELGHSDTKKPGSLPENVDLDVPSKDLLMRLLEIDPSKRLRSLRTLKTISFYKGYNFEAVKEKKVSNIETY